MKKINFSAPAVWLIRWYQKAISSHTPSVCRFTPTCSQYAVEALEKRGLFVGSLLTLFRLLRCNPLFKGGFDPVPAKGFPKIRYKK